ncbi:MAG: ChaN family lipoprotein [Planctomycetota bacterium]
MSFSQIPARARLLQLQRSLADEARQQIEDSIEDTSGSLTKWRKNYLDATKGSNKPVSITKIAEHASTCSVIHFGDYHTLRESQKGPLRVIEKLLEMGHKLILCTEAIHIDSQTSLDRWQRREIDDETLLRESNWDQNWGFPWRNYALQLNFFRERNLPIIALNSEPNVVGNSFSAREQIAAMRITETLSEHEGAILAVIFGDLHVAPAHLPSRVQRLAEKSNRTPPGQCTIFQNIDHVYWELAESGQEQDVHAVEIAEDRFCMLNTTPLVKFQSYLNWQFNEEELEESSGIQNLPSISSSIMTDQIWMIIETIREYLGISAAGLDEFTVHTGRDLNLTDRLQKNQQLNKNEMALIKSQLEKEESCYLPRKRIIVLGNLSIRHAAEEATHHMNFILCKDNEVAKDPVDRFYETALREAIGYLGTKIIDHKRTCLNLHELDSFAEKLRDRKLDPVMTATRQTVKDSIQHIRTEVDWLNGKGDRPGADTIATRDSDIIAGTTHAIGYRLGEKIYNCLVAGKIKTEQIKELFQTSLQGAGQSPEIWFEWAQRSHDPESSSDGSSSRG